MTHVITSAEYAQILALSPAREEASVFGNSPYLVVDTGALSAEPRPMPMLPVIGVEGPEDHPCIDVYAADDSALHKLQAAIDKAPLAAATLVQLLRHNATSSITDGLFAESLAYSTLQQSALFQEWVASGAQPGPSHDEDQLPVVTGRIRNTLQIQLNRPQVHNAFNTAMRDALCEALSVAEMDNTVEEVVITGNGPSFCAGGDLSEFGQVRDAAEAHLSRTTRSAGGLLASLGCRTRVQAHGACIGAGIEVPAFADFIRASPDAFFQLPEVSFGLVPGAGGTVSVTRRIGRHRTAYMALTNERIPAQTALAWGLVDNIEE